MRKRTILITGGAGFIGSHLTDKLIKNNNIIIVDNFDEFYSPKIKEENIKKNISHKNFKLYKIDITDKQSLETVFKKNNIDLVIHLAAKAGVRNSITNPEAYVKTNIHGTINLLELMKQYNVLNLIFGSSSSVYGNCPKAKFSEDDSVAKPISPYAETKLAGEELCYNYHKQFNFNVICLRFFTVYGPRQRPDLAINKFVKLILNEKPITVFGSKLNARSYTYIDDLINGILLAINYDNKKGFEIINLGGEKSITLKEVIKTIEKHTCKKALIDMAPMQKGDVKKTAASLTKAKKLLNYKPEVSFSKGIELFVNCLKNDKT